MPDSKTPELVNHPSHYTMGRVEVIDIVEDWNLGFHMGNAIKYLMRCEHKGAKLTDLKKAQWYLQRWWDLPDRSCAAIREQAEVRVSQLDALSMPILMIVMAIAEGEIKDAMARLSDLICEEKAEKANEPVTEVMSGTLSPQAQKALRHRAPTPLHPARLSHPLEGTLRREWERYIAERPGFDILCGPEVHFSDVPPGVEADENKITGGYVPYPHGRMTERDRLIAAELIQWLGSPLGFAFLSTAFERAGGRVTFDDYKPKP